MRFFLGVVIFSVVSILVFFFLTGNTEWPMEVIVISSLFLGGLTEWLFYKMKSFSGDA
ncbi:hypothetical protein [Salipaludibacillus daqingensis]|uniref:hypothetical protein n=1 Tax=Salipaludibacillus daqingensis TaxID=3041001 RepID=UPI002476CC7F|nr:hypothetical protein [Salipaludibacillus daqingensis]